MSPILCGMMQMGSVKALPLLDQETVEDLHQIQKQVPPIAVEDGVVTQTR